MCRREIQECEHDRFGWMLCRDRGGDCRLYHCGRPPRRVVQFPELITIGGSALGALIVMSPKKVLIDLGRGLVQCVKGSACGKRSYEDLFKALLRHRFAWRAATA